MVYHLKIKKTCYIIKKGRLIHDNIKFYHDNNSIFIDGNMSLEEKCKIFNECKYFYCYDPNTMYVIYSALCGCIPIVYPIKNMSKQNLIENRIYNCGGELIDIGFAYGNSKKEIDQAIEKNKTIAEKNIKRIFNYYSNNVNIFCEEIYNHIFNNIPLKNTVKNYYKS